TLLVAFPKRQPHFHFSTLATELAKVLAAHGDCYCVGDLPCREAGLCRTDPVDRDPHLALTRLRVGADVFQSFDAREQAHYFCSQFVETRRGVAGDLQAEAFTSALLVELEIRFTDRDDRQVLLDSLDDFRGRESRVLFVSKQQRRLRFALVV